MLSAEIQPASRPASIYSPVAHDQAEPGAGDCGRGEVEIPADQRRSTYASGVDQPFAGAVVPIEQQIDPIAERANLGGAFFPFVLAVACDRLVDAAVPSAGPIPFDAGPAPV